MKLRLHAVFFFFVNSINNKIISSSKIEKSKICFTFTLSIVDIVFVYVLVIVMVILIGFSINYIYTF